MASKSKSAPEPIICNGDCFGRSIADDPKEVDDPETLSPSLTEVFKIQSLPGYTYAPLGLSEIRILCLAAGPRTSLLEGQLITAATGMVDGRLQAIERVADSGVFSSRVVKFCALSYTWGDSEKVATIIIAEKVALITKNLEDALRELRKEDENVYLWADAICINQDDLNERANQVSIMLEIYKWQPRFMSGSAVQTRLGYAEQEVEWTRAWIDQGQYQFPATLENRASKSALKHVIHSDSCKEIQGTLYYALQKLYSRPWLRRVWVRQEIFGAREISVICGRDRISWDVFLRGIGLLNSLERNGVQIAEPATVARTLLQSLRNLTKDHPDSRTGFRPSKDLVSTLVSSRHLEAGTENDNIFTLLGMCGVPTTADNLTASLSTENKGIRIDYNQSFERVLRETTSHLLCRANLKDGVDAYFDALAEIFHYRVRRETAQPQTLQSRPSQNSPGPDSMPPWIMDWRACCSLQDFQMIRSICESDRRERERRRGLHGFFRGFRSSCVPDIHYLRSAAPIPEYLPQIQSGSILRLHALVLDVIESPTDRKWDLPSFLQPTSFGPETRCKFKTLKYNASLHTRRAAKLRAWHSKTFSDDSNYHGPTVALVPAGTKPGDLIVLIGPGVLPLVLSPAVPQDMKDEGHTLKLPRKLKRSKPGSGYWQIEHKLDIEQNVLTKDRQYLFRGPALASWSTSWTYQIPEYVRHSGGWSFFEFLLV